MRVFALGPKLSLSWLESRTTYRDKLFALFDRRLRGPGTPLIQRGADDVASHLRGPSDPRRPVQTARDLVVWPESLGLFAALTGSRGAAGRASGSLEGSIVSLIGTYAPTNAYYAARFPALEPCPADPPADAFTDRHLRPDGAGADAGIAVPGEHRTTYTLLRCRRSP